MSSFCLVPELSAKLKQAYQDGKLAKIEDLATMSSEERRALFGKFIDEDSAKGVNTGFEKAWNNESASAMKSWVENTFNSKEKKSPQYKDIIQKIDDLDKQGLLTPENERAFMEDLVAEKLGGTITADEAKNISELAKRLGEEVVKTSEVGTKTLEFYKAKRAMEDYVQSLTPASRLRVFSSTIGRGSMLLSFKSPLLNVVSNSVEGFLALAERRAGERRLSGLNRDFIHEWKNYAKKVYNETGYDLSRYQAFEGGIRALGEEYTHSQGKGAVRAVGRWFEDVAFNKLQGRPDASFARFHFADSANLLSTSMAYGEKLKGKEAKGRALEILKDALNEEPKTKEGAFVKAQAEADALYATYTNKSIASETGLKLRTVFNTASGDLRIGDIVDPFVKTPANVLMSGLDYSGVSLTAKMATGIVKTLNDVAHLKSFDKANFAGTQRLFIKAGLGTTFAFVISEMIKPDDFIGAYPTTPKEQNLFNTRKGVENSIKIGDHFVSLDYLGPLGGPLLGFLYAKKYGGQDLGNAAFQYVRGATGQLSNFPGWQEISDAYKGVTDIQKGLTEKDDVTLGLAKGAVGGVASRIIPGIISDLAKMTDQYDRKVEKTDPLGSVMKTLPFVRERLPIKHDLFGDKVTTENFVSTLLFGARVKDSNDSEVINELVRLDKDNALPAITDVSKSSGRAKALKAQIGNEKYNQFEIEFGQALKKGFLETMRSDDYKALSPDEKKKELDDVKDDIFEEKLDKYGYVKPEKK